MYSECSSLTRCSFIVKLHDCDSDSFTADLCQDEDYLILNGRVTFTGNKFHFCCPIKVLIQGQVYKMNKYFNLEGRLEKQS